MAEHQAVPAFAEACRLAPHFYESGFGSTVCLGLYRTGHCLSRLSRRTDTNSVGLVRGEESE